MDVELARWRGYQVGHSLNMIAELPAHVDDPQTPKALRHAAVDAFFIHVRLLRDFLIEKNSRAIGWRDYTTGFNLPPALRKPLAGPIDVAGREVAHFNKQGRAPDTSTPVHHAMAAADLRPHAEAVFAAMEAFVRHLAAEPEPCVYTADFDGWLRDARRLAAQ
ncbi:MAG: hypothetical protein J2P32_06650 [Actinobacteria bacterium]|nr:hypothetical protein [Actinomycetota bacterium]